MTKHILVGLLVGFCLLTSGQAVYAFCWDYPDAILCDDFDRYCTPEPGDQQTCSSDPAISVVNGRAMLEAWPQSSHGGGGNVVCGGENEIVTPTHELKAGITSPPYAVREYSGGDEGGSYGQQTVDLRGRITSRWGSQYGAIAGTDGNPLVLRFQISGGIQNNFAGPYDASYMEISYDDFTSGGDPYDSNHRAPMDFVWVGHNNGTDCISCRNLLDSWLPSQRRKWGN